MNEIKVAITMDCEPTTQTSHGSATGPKTFAVSERAIRGYFEIARSYGFPVTYFVHPETILIQADLFKELQANGCGVGLHMHPWKYALWRHNGQKFKAHFGELSEQNQIALLSEASALWHQAMGEAPRLFRPGTFSANDSTFRVLEGLGFSGGSISAPGRIFREIKSVWVGAEPDPHRAHANFRLVPGDLKFANMPLSADFSTWLTTPNGRKRHPDFRPDIDWVEKYGISYQTIANNITQQILERAPSVPVINSISHNHFDYSDPSDPACQRFKGMLDEIAKACDRAKLKTVGSTVSDVVDCVTKSKPRKEEFLYI